MATTNRRNFLRDSLTGGLSSAAVLGAFSQFLGCVQADESPQTTGFGPLSPTSDATTGLPLLQLPEGFRYCSFGWTNEPLSDGTPTPGAHDGMAVIQEKDDQIVLCRNHELSDPGKAFGRVDRSYDRSGAGGCTNLVFDRRAEKFRSAYVSLSGTVKNCAGGVTPWGSWLSCEETVVGPESSLEDGVENPFTRPHGFVFDVPVQASETPQPIESLGRFVHEAVAIDPASQIVYLTEDRDTAGLYRMVPDQPGDLHAGGKFQMLATKQTRDVRRGIDPQQVFDVYWVDIEDRLRAHSPGTQDELGVYTQGRDAGGLTFARLEGCAFHDGHLFLTATSGGDAQAGQVWKYDPREEQLTLIFESPAVDVLDMPDNMAISPRNGILLCEDGKQIPQRIQVLTADGKLFPLAANNVRLEGLHGHRGDFRDSEWAGATFSADGTWLFVNLQTPGVTFAITGPWQEGLI